MNKTFIIKYLKKQMKIIPFRVVIFLLIYFLVQNKNFSIGYLILWTIDLIEGFFRFIKRERYLKELEAKGLTEEAINREDFFKQWEENRERGLLKYCLIDGGIIAGALFSVAVSLVWIFVVSRNSQPFADGPGQIFEFIGITYLIGGIIGMIIYRINWHISQKKFYRLTNSSY